VAYLFNAGTRDNPRLVGRYRKADGKWSMKTIPAEHAGKKADARRWLDDFQKEIDEAAEAGRPDPSRIPTCGELIPLWLASLETRNAYSDRKTAEKHLLPAFQAMRPAKIENSDIVRWIDRLKNGRRPLSGGTQRGCPRSLCPRPRLPMVHAMVHESKAIG
jgi:hypothetical protein